MLLLPFFNRIFDECSITGYLAAWPEERTMFLKKAYGFFNFLILQAVPCISRPRKSKVGGQAVIEGVMMRGKKMISWAVKKPAGEIILESFPFVSASRKHAVLKWPVFRGAVNLFESLKIGYRALSRSAEIAYDEEVREEDKNWKTTLTSIGTFVFAFGLSIFLFLYLPMLLLTLLGFEKSAFAFNFLAGIIRIALFLGYLLGISLWKDIRRLFEYHGAEHKAIFAFEDGKELTIENMTPYKTFHPRCGTSFIILVSLVCILLFSVIDALILHFILDSGYPVWLRLIVHLGLIPIVSGVSYEVLKLSDRYRHVFPFNLLVLPGLWLQRITTREPDNNQLEIATRALKAVL
ncbi:MAG: DUF1385 domain-containing protein [Chitinivibrionales bacterium]|nr:DUF1385 domain-containing protein [Chitinivibrionales bacterium]